MRRLEEITNYECDPNRIWELKKDINEKTGKTE